MSTLLAVTNDLMATAPIEHAARQLGASCRSATAAQLDDLQLPKPPQLVVLDLTVSSDVASTVQAIRSVVGFEAPIVAFGPHVHEAILQAADDAGCARVLTRGQFHRDMVSVLGEFLD